MHELGKEITVKQWELARYLIDAKKCVDSLLFIEQNNDSLANISLREVIDDKRSMFYTKCCFVLDETLGKAKKATCDSDPIIKRLYYERDKNTAHKDSDYAPIKYESLSSMIEDLKLQLIRVRELGTETPPSVISLDFVSHDRMLFRQVHGITAEKEGSIEQAKYAQKNKHENRDSGITRKVFHDTEDIREINSSEAHDYATLFENGINRFEGLQNRQDSCIKTNVLFGENIWTSPDRDAWSTFEQLNEIGFLDECDIFHREILSDPKVLERFEEILSDIHLP